MGWGGSAFLGKPLRPWGGLSERERERERWGVRETRDRETERGIEYAFNGQYWSCLFYLFLFFSFKAETIKRD